MNGLEWNDLRLILAIGRNGSLTGAATEAEAAAALGDLLGSEALRDIVLYHVIAGDAVSYEAAFATKPGKAKNVEMANGDSIVIRNYRITDGTGNRVWPKMGALDILATLALVAEFPVVD